MFIVNKADKNDIVVPEVKNEETSNEDKDIVDDSKQSNKTNDLSYFSRVVFQKDKSILTVNDLNGENLIRDLEALSGSTSFDSVTGKYLKEIASNNFGINDVSFVDITCGFEHSDGTTNVMHKYNKETDKYENNPEHKGHGGGSNGIGYNFIGGKTGIVDDYYTYTVGIYYSSDGCVTDTCGPLTSLDVYLNYEDAVNKTNRVMNVVDDSECCNKIDVGYSCDPNIIYSKINNAKKVIFYYKKENNNYVFSKYEIN